MQDWCHDATYTKYGYVPENKHNIWYWSRYAINVPGFVVIVYLSPPIWRDNCYDRELAPVV